MKPTSKIYIAVALWLVVTGAVFGFGLPKLFGGLTELQNSHQQQTDQYNQLRAQAASLETMKKDIDALKQQQVQPSDFFSTDLHLVNEIKQLETDASKSNVKTSIVIPGSADKAEVLKGSTAGLLVIPYTLKVTGDFPSLVTFLSYMQNNFFISPVTGINITADQDKSLNTSVFASFFIRKDLSQSAAPQSASSQSAASGTAQ